MLAHGGFGPCPLELMVIASSFGAIGVVWWRVVDWWRRTWKW